MIQQNTRMVVQCGKGARGTNKAAMFIVPVGGGVLSELYAQNLLYSKWAGK